MTCAALETSHIAFCNRNFKILQFSASGSTGQEEEQALRKDPSSSCLKSHNELTLGRQGSRWKLLPQDLCSISKGSFGSTRITGWVLVIINTSLHQAFSCLRIPMLLSNSSPESRVALEGDTRHWNEERAEVRHAEPDLPCHSKH